MATTHPHREGKSGTLRPAVRRASALARHELGRARLWRGRDRCDPDRCGRACLVHALVPAWFTQTAGKTVDRMHDHMTSSAKPTPPIRRAGLTTKSDRCVPVAIVGGGASGTILAAQLARRGIQSVLIDGSGRMAAGVAYSTTEGAHLLNVRAEGMSALPGEPDHFAKRFEAEGGDRRGFAQRRLFGRYLGELLDEAVASGRTGLVDASAIGRQRADGRWRIELNDGSPSKLRRWRSQSATRTPSRFAPSRARAGVSSPIHGARMPPPRSQIWSHRAAMPCLSARA